MSRPKSTRKFLARVGDTHPRQSLDDMCPPKPGTCRVVVAMHATHSGVTTQMPVTLPAWPEGWADDGETGPGGRR